MSIFRKSEINPRNGRTLVVGIVARISGCANQKEQSLDDQVDHGKEFVREMYDGPAEYKTIRTRGKGERLDRPELQQIERMVRTRELDLLVMEDVGRLVRGTEASRLWGVAVDHGTRCLAPNDCCDTDDDTWEEDLLSACRDHVSHNAHASRRIKKKLMNRFVRGVGATPCEIAGYEKPEGAKTYDDWIKDTAATTVIRKGLKLLRQTLNCSAVADFFNETGFPLGKYARNDSWDGAMVRRFYMNPLLKGQPGRGFRHSVKHHETGRRVSVRNPNGPVHVDYPDLAHVSAAELDEVNAMLAERNSSFGRKPANGIDPKFQVPRKRTRFPGQHAVCWYCGRQYVWGGNGMTDNLMCAGSRQWLCWNSIGIPGPAVARILVEKITSELLALDGFADQYVELLGDADSDSNDVVQQKLRELEQRERQWETEKQNVVDAIAKLSIQPYLQAKLLELEGQEKALAIERGKLSRIDDPEVAIPETTDELRRIILEQFESLANDSPEFGTLMRLVVPHIHVYLVRLCDGGPPLPRARVALDLIGSIEDDYMNPQLRQALSRVYTLDLFVAPKRDRLREKIVALSKRGLNKKQIVRQLPEPASVKIVTDSLNLNAIMQKTGLGDPYVLLTEPPADYAKLRRHRNKKYRFEPFDGYQPPGI